MRDPDTAQSAGFIWVFPLTFVSSAFVPLDSMPAAIRAFAGVNPVTTVIDAARTLMIGHGRPLMPSLETFAWLVGVLLVFVPLSVRIFRRVQ